jgi:RimJ/RimL family protein N-acetyltransferase
MTERLPGPVLAPFDFGAHGALLADWLARPQVAKWFGAPAPHLAFAAAPPDGAGQAVIVWNGIPIGYLRWRAVGRADLDAAGLSEIPDGATDSDLFIGETALQGKGLGQAALAELQARLGDAGATPMLALTTSIDNIAALAAFERMGFQRYQQYETPEFGRCWLLTRDWTTAQDDSLPSAT